MLSKKKLDRAQRLIGILASWKAQGCTDLAVLWPCPTCRAQARTPCVTPSGAPLVNRQRAALARAYAQGGGRVPPELLDNSTHHAKRTHLSGHACNQTPAQDWTWDLEDERDPLPRIVVSPLFKRLLELDLIRADGMPLESGAQPAVIAEVTGV